MIPSTDIEYYGDETRWFIGNVVDINDPLHLGRVRVRIYGIHSPDTVDIPLGTLPWAQVVSPTTEGGSSGIGANTGLKPMAQVYGVFLDGKNSQLPLVLGSIPKYESVIVKPIESDVTMSDNPAYTDGPITSKNKLPASEVDKNTLRGTNNMEKAYNFFLSNEIPGGPLKPCQAAGIVGNLIVESTQNGDISPTALNNPEGSYGIAQWNPNAGKPSRLSQLREFASVNNLPVDSLYTQLRFIVYELFVVPENFGMAKLLAAEDVETACSVFEKYYEKPALGTSAKRLSSAREIYSKMES
jgi:hypothetical protein